MIEFLEHLFSTNEFGFRQLKNVSIAKPGNVRRIAFVGDSVTLGREVEFNRIFSEIFRGIVDAGLSSPQIESLNFGIDGYNTPQIAELLFTSVFQFSPDVVIYSLCLNDFDFEEASGNKIKFFNKLKSFFLRALTGALKRVIANDYHSYYYQKNKHVVFRTISEMHRQTLQRGAEFYVVILPVFKGDRIGRTGRVYRYELASFEKYPLPDMHREITWALKNRDIRVFDLLPDFVRSGRAAILFRGRRMAYERKWPRICGSRHRSRHFRIRTEVGSQLSGRQLSQTVAQKNAPLSGASFSLDG